VTTALVDPTPMAEEKRTASVKLHIDVIEAARIVSAYRNEPMTDMLSNLLRPIMAEMEREEVARRTKDHRTKGGSK
jgi:hypothetical protein